MKNVSKRLGKTKRKLKRKLVLLGLRQKEIQIVQLGNAIDADPKIILSLIVRNLQKTEKRKTERKYVLAKRRKAIALKITVTMKMNTKYTHPWHDCQMMT